MTPSLDDLLVRQAVARGRHPAVVGIRPLDYAGLARRVAAAADWVAGLPQMVGLYGPKCTDWVVADLALTVAGKTLVPLPEFFSAGQLAHVAADAGLDTVVTVGAVTAEDLPAGLLMRPFGSGLFTPRGPVTPGPARRIIYTSGTTGRPKGVILEEAQVAAAAAALVRAVGATGDDVHLSVLPHSLLLEQVAGIRAPLLAGATAVICADGFTAALAGDPGPLVAAAEAARPTVTVLVPELLAGWVAALRAARRRAPETLRFVAVGGAAVPSALAEAAWSLGLPAHEGYGLSECCSVVALNRPGDRRPGTVGLPLPGLLVVIDDGEIVVHGPTVMGGYKGGAPHAGPWRTGDLGRFTADGSLQVFGRLDEVIVTAFGRNVSPEWIEAQVLADPAVARAVAFDDGGAFPALAVCFAGEDGRTAGQRLAAILATLPDYARPRRIVTGDLARWRAAGLIGPGGKPRRKAFAAHYALPDAMQEVPCLSTNA